MENDFKRTKSTVTLIQYRRKLLTFLKGTIDVDEMVEIVGNLYEMEGVCKVC